MTVDSKSRQPARVSTEHRGQSFDAAIKKFDVLVLGAGSWGSALAIRIAMHGHCVALWARDRELARQLTHERVNAAYLPDCPFSDSITVVTDLGAACESAREVLVVVPSHGFRDFLERLRDVLAKDQNIAWATKGFEPQSHSLLGDAALEILGKGRDYAVVSGPTFAKEIALGLPAAITVSSTGTSFADTVAAYLRGPALRVYVNHDPVGVSVGGAVKNVLAIATGIGDGLQLGANTRAALIARGLHEMVRLGVAMGGQADTLMGLAGLGDLVLTCTDDLSRNRRFGLALGRGQSVDAALHSVGQVVEGMQAAEVVLEIAARMSVEMPICEQVTRVVRGQADARAAAEALLARAPAPEI